ncbi:MAG TPA: heparinase II/III family protein [Chthoniobacteraceae bacterium]|nr:heparinase II/III family protein [Chthoniobacteraceae bacterium]
MNAFDFKPLLPHPRLYVPPEAFSRLPERVTAAWFAPFYAVAAGEAEAALDIDGFPDVGNGHNWHLHRAKVMQARIVNLALMMQLTGEPRYLRAAMKHIEMMRDWEYWSWITWRHGNADPSAIFDLSYGENSATLAIALDWLHPWLTPADVSLIVETARRPIDSILFHTRGKNQPHWAGAAGNNWNAVCAGGIGMLALSLFEKIPEEAAEILSFVEDSMVPYMEGLEAFNGAWPEGIGYWNYGMRYAFMYLLSCENATGKPHRWITQPATKDCLYFPADFCPHGIGCSFGDANSWFPLPIHHAMARRLEADDLAADLRARHDASERRGRWPFHAETLLLVPEKGRDPSIASEVARLYTGQDWGFLADRMPDPSLYLSFRGGTTDVLHGHHDLTSFHLVLGDERAIYNIGLDRYLDSTFSPRRHEVYETMAASKNVVLINGLGGTSPSCVTTLPLDPGPGLRGFRLDATAILGESYDGARPLNYHHRLFLMIEGRAFLILDSLELPQVGLGELRFHTEMTPTAGEASVLLNGRRQKGAISLASNQPGRLLQGTALQTLPGLEPVHVIRWLTHGLHHRIVFASLFVPGETPTPLRVNVEGDRVAVTLELAGVRRSLTFSHDLANLC